MQNVRSIRNKFEEIETFPKIQNYPEIIELTETWLSPEEEHLYNINGYNAIFRSRQTRGGGILIYLKHGIEYKEKINSITNKIEIITVELVQEKVSITLIYKPPHVDFTKLEYTLINNIVNRKKSLIIMGDFNINIMEKNTLIDNILQHISRTKLQNSE